MFGWTNPDGNKLEGFTLPLTGDEVFRERYKSWKKKDPVFHQVVEGAKLKKHIEFSRSHHYESIKEVDEMVRTQFPDPTIFYCGNFPHGYLHILSGSLITADEELLMARFTKVLEMTYSRFLDLKKAEEQAREAQIEVALERIRARALAMHTSDEIPEVANVLRKQMGLLGQAELAVSAVHIYPEDSSTFDSWWAFRPSGSTRGKIITGTSKFRIKTSALAQEFLDMYHADQNQYTVYTSGKNLREWQK